MKNSILILSLSVLLAACASTPSSTGQAAAPQAEPATSAAPPSTDATLATPSSEGVTAGAMTESAKVAEQQGLQDKSIYFDFDSFAVKPEYRALLQQHVEILKAHPRDSVTLEGNADERGSPEYNLALGAKRARAVRAQMVLLGIAQSRMHEASFGEEKPRATCHDESCWKQNRRVDFAYRSNQ